MLTLARWLARAPLWLLHSLGAVGGRLVWALSGTYRQRFRRHAERAGIGAADRRAAVAEAGRLVGELPRLWLGPDWPTGEASRVGRVSLRWTGAEHVETALATGRGLLFLTPHLGCFEVTAQAYAARFGGRQPITVLYRPARQAWLRELERTARDRPGLRAVPATLAGVRELLRALRRGEAVGLLPDQVPPQGLGVWAPFFGQPAYTMTLAGRLVQQTGAVPLLVWGERLPRGAGYVVHVEPLDDAERLVTAPQAESAALVNRAMERLILRCPRQYLWGYDRYKAPRAFEALRAEPGAEP
jgi:KDO2-lipid IV(A) lauroyltransferase